MNSNYDLIAEEYYDQEQHPTCADFGVASRSLLHHFLNRVQKNNRALEFGAGRSELAYFAAGALAPDNLIISDASLKMLKHSISIYQEKARFIICNANALPIDSESCDITVSSLGDPYNIDSFWMETFRVLRWNGRGIFTTPSWEWAEKFRLTADQEKRGNALFFNKNNEKIYLNSNILNHRDQIKLIEKSGLTVDKILHFSLNDLQSMKKNASFKLSRFLSAGDPIVTAYHVIKAPHAH